MGMGLFQYLCVVVVGLLLLMLPLPSHSATATVVVVDGVTNWNHPIVTIGDSIIFKHKYHYTLYIFRSRLAFNLCNFTQASILTTLNSSSYTWHPSRLGNFYFSFNNGTNKPCQQGQKISIKVIPETTTTAVLPPAQSPPSSVAVPPTPGGVSSSPPGYPWPFQPHEKSAGLDGSPAPVAAATTTTMPVVPGGKGGTVPFINSNPAVPLPTGEVDSATVSPLPTLASNHAARLVVYLGLVMPPCISILLNL